MIKNYPLWKVNPLNQFSAYIEEKEKNKKEKKVPKENSGLMRIWSDFILGAVLAFHKLFPSSETQI